VIETERLRLRKPSSADVDGVLRSVSDPEVMEFTGTVTNDPADARAAIERWLGRWDADGLGMFVVTLRGEDEMIGRTGVLVWDTRTWTTSTARDAGEHGQPELGWSFARAHWGHGYATEAARAARAWAFEQGVASLISLIHPDNVRSIRVAQKLGAEPTEPIEVLETPAVVWRHPRGGQPPAR
jgi:RimJ/RimL family protein N-acetyltransferase